MSEQPSCEDRIEESLRSRIEDLRDMVNRMRSGVPETEDEAREEAAHYGLSLDIKRVVTWQLSTGGPGDEFRFTVDDRGNVERIEYVFLDWWDGASRVLSGAQFDAVEEFYEYEIRPFVGIQQ